MSRSHPFVAFEEQILRQIIAPKISDIVDGTPDIESRTKLLSIFNTTYSSHVTMATFGEWCDKLGITFEKRVVVNIPGYKPAAREVQPVTEESAEESVVAQFDEPKTMPDVPARYEGGERMVMPGGMRIPTFMENL